MIIGDDGRGGITGIVTSANPHDASSLHSNVALQLSGAALEPLLESELALAARFRMAGQLDAERAGRAARVSPENAARVQVLTESEIRAAILRNFAGARAGDSIDIAMFYLSDREVIDALLAAARRGVAVRVILDPNKDAFGRTKNGIPNRSVATELAAASDGAIKVRWYRTHGEQFHAKLVALRTVNEFWFTLGSANLTRRNLEDFNLEANVAAGVPLNSELAAHDQRLVRDAVEPTRARPHSSTPRNSAPTPILPGHVLALSADGVDRPVYFLALAAGGGSLATAAAAACASSFIGGRRRGAEGGDHRIHRSSAACAEPCAVKLASSARSRCRPSVQSSATYTVGAPPPCRVVRFEAPQCHAQVVLRRVWRSVVEARRRTCRCRAAHR